MAMRNLERHLSHVNLEEIGKEGQARIANSSVVVVGAGGLASGTLPLLASSGFGKITIIDGDKIELSNLNRQPIYSEEDIGKPKAIVATEKIKGINRETEVVACPEFISPENIDKLIGKPDIIIDCSDNAGTHYLLSDYGYVMDVPVVFGAAEQFTGQVAVFNGKNKVTYRDIFPEPDFSHASCSEIGVLSTLPALIGTLQASEAIKYITDLEGLDGKLLIIDLKNNVWETISIQSTASKKQPKTLTEIKQLDYKIPCVMFGFFKKPYEIGLGEAKQWLKRDDVVWIDVRGNAMLRAEAVPHKIIPAAEFEQRINEIPKDKTVVLFCNTGNTSGTLTQLLRQMGYDNVFSLKANISDFARMAEEQL
ncbi:MAG: hypothetical protein GXO48_07425 [Chlorobi bacterium]|nr:hypothetical protein [Chlorobiota bacterium]